MFRGALQPWHLLILVLVIVIVFGWKRLPDAARSLGRSARILKSEMDEMKSESAASKATVDGETVKESEARMNNQATPGTTSGTTSGTTPGATPQSGHPDGFPQRGDGSGPSH